MCFYTCVNLPVGRLVIDRTIPSAIAYAASPTHRHGAARRVFSVT
jgi:hypothetical protein